MWPAGSAGGGLRELNMPPVVGMRFGRFERDLAQGEAVLVSTGSLAAFAQSVDYDIQGVSGCRRMVFGGEGLFMTRLSGPGRVLLQTLKRTTPGTKESH